jgi:hypothetical protein
MTNIEISFTMTEIEILYKNFSFFDPLLLKVIILKDPILVAKFKKLLGESLFNNTMQDMETFGLIKITGNDLTTDFELRPKLIDTLKKPASNVADWIDQWRELFPKGSNRGGYRYRGDKQGCLKKMIKFVKTNPSIKIPEIFAATKNYIHSYEVKNDFQYIKLAHYFIEKDGISTLASNIEGLTEEQIEDFNFVSRL